MVLLMVMMPVVMMVHGSIDGSGDDASGNDDAW